MPSSLRLCIVGASLVCLLGLYVLFLSVSVLLATLPSLRLMPLAPESKRVNDPEEPCALVWSEDPFRRLPTIAANDARTSVDSSLDRSVYSGTTSPRVYRAPLLQSNATSLLWRVVANILSRHPLVMYSLYTFSVHCR